MYCSRLTRTPSVDWADLVTLDLNKFDQPGGKQELAAQLFDAVNRIGKILSVPFNQLSRTIGESKTEHILQLRKRSR